MPSSPAGRKHRRLGIAIRIALLAWLVAMATLVIFIFMTMPQQKKMFLQQLESKANSVSLSLHDAAAGAALNEDYASVISAAQTMLAGDPGLDFLLVMKNDGFALVIEQEGWCVDQRSDAYWLDRERRPDGGINKVPLFDRRVFHFAKPFDYSGIQWGWIHVGLSLDYYDHSVKSLYGNTIALGLGCIAFSLMISLGFARRVVKPVLRLRTVVQKIAGGDLSVRADRLGTDEIGSLAGSVNIMTEALLRRDQVLESVRFAAQKFMVASAWEEIMDDVLAKMGRATDVSRVYIFENHPDDAGDLCMSQKFEWTAAGISTELENPELQNLPYDAAGFGRWRTVLGSNQILSGRVSAMPDVERAVLEPQEIRSIIVIPIFVEEKWWGFMGFDDCSRERTWSSAEKDSLRAGADILGATIVRQRFQEELLEAKATLEQRVRERTRELQAQVTAKEEALAELAETQSSLLEVSRAAGMAEVATGVLHNVGNVLNSVNVSCTLVLDQLRESRLGNLSRVTALFPEKRDDLPRFLTDDPRGRKIPDYLASLAPALEAEHRLMQKETESLQERIEHIKEIVAMQQSYGRVSGVIETIPAEQLMEDALKLNVSALARHKVEVRREYETVSPVAVDKHAVLQILLNLINNAKYACTDSDREERILTLKIRNKSRNRIQMVVDDNGIGISPENLTKVFQHGFTTKQTGHGFGLHSGALAARKLGGRLSVHSDGAGHGAAFTLELPCSTGENP